MKTIGLVIAAVSAVACIPPAGTPSYFASYPAQQQQAAASTESAEPGESTASVETGSASCIEIFQCLVTCTESSCFQQCYERGAAPAQQAAASLIACGQTGGTCEAELNVCRAQSGVVAQAAPAPAAAPVVAQGGKRAPVANHQVLAWLVQQGSWKSSNHQFEFTAGNNVRRSGGHLRSNANEPSRREYVQCAHVINEVGTATQQGDIITIVFGVKDGYTCGVREKTAGITIRYRIEWIDNPYYEYNELQLRLRDLDCTNGDMWCVDQMYRRK